MDSKELLISKNSTTSKSSVLNHNVLNKDQIFQAIVQCKKVFQNPLLKRITLESLKKEIQKWTSADCNIVILSFIDEEIIISAVV